MVRQVGGVRFEAFSKNVYGRLISHQESVQKFKPLKRGSAFQNWDFGQMKVVGSRVPQGGKAGDAYTAYTGIEGSTAEELELLFEHAFVRFFLVLLINFEQKLPGNGYASEGYRINSP